MAMTRIELAITASATRPNKSTSPAPIPPATRAKCFRREYVSGSYEVGYEGSTAGSSFTDAATAPTWVTMRTWTSRLAGKGLVELRLARLSSPGRLLASASACSAVTEVTDETRGAATRPALVAATASEVASGAR